MNCNPFNIVLKLRDVLEYPVIKSLKNIIVLILFSCFNPEGIMNMSAAIWFPV